MNEGKAVKAAPYSSTDETETLAVDIFEYLVDHKKAKLDTRKRDKFPNIDGYIELIDEFLCPIGKLEVQIRKLPDGVTKIQCPLSLFAYSEKTPLPVLFVGVDTKQKKAYWFHVNVEELPQQLERYRQETIVIQFPPDNVIDGNDTKYLVEWKNIAESNLRKLREFEKYRKLMEGSNPAIGIEKKEFRDMQLFLDEFNELLDGKFSVVKKTFYPTSWKIGLAYYTYEDNKLEYALYPVQFGKNDVLIKEIDAKLHEQLKNEGVGWTGYYKENPIRLKPKEHAINVIEENLSRIIEKRLLSHRGSSFLAQEFIFAFIDKFREQMGLEPEEAYKTLEIERAFFRYLPLWTHEAIKFMLRVQRNNVKSIAGLLYGRPYFDPQMLIIQIMKNERKQIANAVRERIERNDSLPIMPIGNRDFPFRVFFELISFLKAKRIDKIQRVYLQKDYSRLAKSNWIYNLFSPAVLEENLKNFFNNLPTVYNNLLLTNFPELVGDLSLFNGGSLILVVFDFKEEIKSRKDLPHYDLYALKPKEKSELRIEVYTKDQAEGLANLNFANFRKTVDVKGKPYQIVYAQKSMLDFIYEDLPMFNFVYASLKNNLEKYFNSNRKSS